MTQLKQPSLKSIQRISSSFPLLETERCKATGLWSGVNLPNINIISVWRDRGSLWLTLYNWHWYVWGYIRTTKSNYFFNTTMGLHVNWVPNSRQGLPTPAAIYGQKLQENKNVGVVQHKYTSQTPYSPEVGMLMISYTQDCTEVRACASFNMNLAREQQCVTGRKSFLEDSVFLCMRCEWMRARG